MKLLNYVVSNESVEELLSGIDIDRNVVEKHIKITTLETIEWVKENLHLFIGDTLEETFENIKQFSESVIIQEVDPLNPAGYGPGYRPSSSSSGGSGIFSKVKFALPFIGIAGIFEWMRRGFPFTWIWKSNLDEIRDITLTGPKDFSENYGTLMQAFRDLKDRIGDSDSIAEAIENREMLRAIEAKLRQGVYGLDSQEFSSEIQTMKDALGSIPSMQEKITGNIRELSGLPGVGSVETGLFDQIGDFFGDIIDGVKSQGFIIPAAALGGALLFIGAIKGKELLKIKMFDRNLESTVNSFASAGHRDISTLSSKLKTERESCINSSKATENKIEVKKTLACNMKYMTGVILGMASIIMSMVENTEDIKKITALQDISKLKVRDQRLKKEFNSLIKDFFDYIDVVFKDSRTKAKVLSDVNKGFSEIKRKRR